MNKNEAIEAVKTRSREMGHSLSTEKTYAHWIGRYCDYMNYHRDGSPDGFLNGLATGLMGKPPVSPKTQKQALNALNHLYKHVLKRDMGKLQFRYSEKSRRVPVFVTHSECHTLFGQMSGVTQLQAQLMYGSGLRVSEMLRLRIKDLDFQNHTIIVRSGKGDKDRTVPMPISLADQLREQVEKSAHWWKVDREQGNPPPEISQSLAQKLGRQITEFSWFWLFPASNLSTCPRTSITRRHHLTNAGIAKAMKAAASRSGIRKRISPHVMRHSFATESLRNGLDIKSLATLLGHKSTATTEIYLHCLPDLAFRAISPLDTAPSNIAGNIAPFPAPALTAVSS